MSTESRGGTRESKQVGTGAAVRTWRDGELGKKGGGPEVGGERWDWARTLVVVVVVVVVRRIEVPRSGAERARKKLQACGTWSVCKSWSESSQGRVDEWMSGGGRGCC